MRTREHESVRQKLVRLVECQPVGCTAGLVAQLERGRVTYLRVLRENGKISGGAGPAPLNQIADDFAAELLRLIELRGFGKVGVLVTTGDADTADHRVFSEQTYQVAQD